MSAAPLAVELDGISQTFGHLKALSGVNLRVRTGERRVILGPNGAGKTTLFNVVCGDTRPSEGRVGFFDADITALPPHARARIGIGRTYQNSLLFNGLSVLDNLCLAVWGVRPGRYSPFRVSRRSAGVVAAYGLAQQVRLDNRLHVAVEDLAYGQRRQLELGMALASNPRLLMLDEPAAGLSPGDRPELLRLLRALPPKLTLILIEHDMDIALALADTITVMKDGEVLLDDVPDKIEGNALVQAVYLGERT